MQGRHREGTTPITLSIELCTKNYEEGGSVFSDLFCSVGEDSVRPIDGVFASSVAHLFCLSRPEGDR